MASNTKKNTKLDMYEGLDGMHRPVLVVRNDEGQDYATIRRADDGSAVVTLLNDPSVHEMFGTMSAATAWLQSEDRIPTETKNADVAAADSGNA